MAVFRCILCVDPATGKQSRDFEAKEPVCPHCKSTSNAILKVETIHFDPPSGVPGKGKNKAACNPIVGPSQSGLVHMTGEPANVTCAACKRTEVYKLNSELWGIPQLVEQADRDVSEEK